MGPVLALELSTDGIFLHELSYDGKWRQISAAPLNDPYLPKKMAAMRAAARASQGRSFKNELWVPQNQMIVTQMTLSSDDDRMREVEAKALAADDPNIPKADYIVRVGDETASGEYSVALINKAIVAEAIRFAKGYGFGIDGITVPEKVNGFYRNPYFDSPTLAKPVIVNVRRIVKTLAAGGLAAGLVYGGWWIYNSIEFSPNLATVIEATENQSFSEQEDPRAPIRPTATTAIIAKATPDLADSGSQQNPVTNVDSNIDGFLAHVGETDMASSLFVDPEPVPASPLDQISFWQEAPLQAAQSRPDSLPAPESRGFPTVLATLPAQPNITQTPNLTLELSDAEYVSKRPANDFTATPDLSDRLPNEESTVVLAALERKLNDGFGLTQVRENDADLVRRARIAGFQNAAPVIVTGLPDFTPILRSGADITDIIDLPPVEVAAIDPPSTFLNTLQLQALPPIVEEGLPDIIPPLRGGVEIGAEPVLEAPEETPVAPLSIAELQALEPEIVSGDLPYLPELRPDVLAAADEVPTDNPVPDIPVTETELAALEPAVELSLEELQNLAPEVIQGQPEVVPVLRETDVTVSTTNVPELSLEELQNLTAVVEQGRPPVVPTLRDGVEIGAVTPVAAPAEPDLSIEELQNLPAEVTEGVPDIVPPLRNEPEPPETDTTIDEIPEPAATAPSEPPRDLTLAELQNLAAVVEQGRPPVVPTLRSGEPVDKIDLTPDQIATQIAALQAEEPLVLEGRPPVIPELRDQIDLGEGTGVVAPDIATESDSEAARYRPVFRPASITDIARINDPTLSEVAVVSATAPPRRPAGFADKVASMIQEISEAPIVTEPRFTDTPRDVSLPTSANVAAAATLDNVINLRATNLIGVYGTPGAYRALVRLNGGRYLMVTIGESIGSGWTVVGIDESSIRVQKGSRTETLGLPG